MMPRLTPRSAILVVVGAVILVGLVGWFAFVSPQRSKAAALQVEIAALETRLELAERIKSGDDPEARAVQIRRLARAMPDEVGMPQILRQLSEAARSARVRINGITPSQADATGAVPISLTVDGHYFGLANFIQFLHSKAGTTGAEIRVAGRLYKVDSITFGGSAGEGQISASLILNAFRYAGAPAAVVTTPTDTTADTTGSAAETNG
jgi:hypothetical protein